MAEKTYPKIGEVVASAGGEEAVAEKIGLSVFAVRQWRLRQIPRKYIDTILEMCNGAHDLEDVMRARTHEKETPVE